MSAALSAAARQAGCFALVGAAAFPDERLGGYVLTALILVAAGIAASEWGAARKRALESAE